MEKVEVFIKKTVKTEKLDTKAYPQSYREKKIGRTVYCITSVYMGETEFVPMIEALAIQKVLSNMRNT